MCADFCDVGTRIAALSHGALCLCGTHSLHWVHTFTSPSVNTVPCRRKPLLGFVCRFRVSARKVLCGATHGLRLFVRLVLGMNVAGRCSARSIPLSSPSSGLQAGYCAPSLSDSSGFCCTQSDLTAWENQFGYYPSGIALRGSTCRRAWRKVNCAIACDASSSGWWDASISRAHLCTNVCQDLWQCYTPGFTTTHGVLFDSMTSFCNYHSGPKRPDLNACLGYYAGEETSSTANFLTIGVGFLLGPPSPPRPADESIVVELSRS